MKRRADLRRNPSVLVDRKPKATSIARTSVRIGFRFHPCLWFSGFPSLSSPSPHRLLFFGFFRFPRLLLVFGLNYSDRKSIFSNGIITIFGCF